MFQSASASPVSMEKGAIQMPEIASVRIMAPVSANLIVENLSAIVSLPSQGLCVTSVLASAVMEAIVFWTLEVSQAVQGPLGLARMSAHAMGSDVNITEPASSAKP